jgi:hypothetical protein
LVHIFEILLPNLRRGKNMTSLQGCESMIFSSSPISMIAMFSKINSLMFRSIIFQIVEPIAITMKNSMIYFSTDYKDNKKNKSIKNKKK